MSLISNCPPDSLQKAKKREKLDIQKSQTIWPIEIYIKQSNFSRYQKHVLKNLNFSKCS